ncbi:MAG: amino acid racemase [Anaeromicrobium sp.]|jgi:aspartate racemase|uniref:aspartate/glutamate racemase family protein n=1 Tax=Anaeromicrobium sp. TaxID=1929132 RepID=UPI0025FAD08E|nr:amino acid racemase [Anaeromicrobium sp.]MCT4595515.1 amino acid racemase [Anaeromicrobium sp.]
MKKTVGIIGGMGPMATIDLFKKIVNNTPAHSDQSHLHIVIDNNTSIPDRSTYILEGGENPTGEISSSARNLISIGANILIMPCNTAHYFYNDVCKTIEDLITHKNIIFINMIEETAKYISNNIQGSEKVYLLGTKGTYKSMIYEKAFESYNMELIEPSKELKQKVMDMIYDYKNGKFNYTHDDLYDFKKDALSRGAKKIILGCTELPLIFQIFDLVDDTIDPTEILAKAAIEKATSEVLGAK